MKVYTIKDIASLAGVGISTVSRVLNNRPDVSEETKQKVMDVVKAYNYTQNNNAKNLKQRNADLISIIVRGRQNSFLNDVAERIIECGNMQGQQFLLDFLDEHGDEIEAARQHIAEKKTPAVIFLGANVVGRGDEIASLNTPCLFTTIDTGGLHMAGVSSVSVDNKQAARTAIDHLLDMGHRKIAIFGGVRQVDDGIGHRYRGVLESFANHGLQFDDSLYVNCSFNMEKAYKTARRFLEGKPDFTALFAMSDIMAIGIIKALDDCGKRVPQDVSVVGFDGIALSRFTLPTLTTIAQPAQELAKVSVDLIRELLQNPEKSRHVIVPSHLLEGGSVRKIG